jgi:hypothetical protein
VSFTANQAPDPHVAVVSGSGLNGGSFTTIEGNVSFPVPGAPIGSAVGGKLTVNGRDMSLVGSQIFVGPVDDEVRLLLEPDIDMDQERRIAAHRQRDIERLLGGDEPEG